MDGEHLSVAARAPEPAIDCHLARHTLLMPVHWAVSKGIGDQHALFVIGKPTLMISRAAAGPERGVPRTPARRFPLLKRRGSEGTSLGEYLGPVFDGTSFHELCYSPGNLFAAPRRRFDRVGVVRFFRAD